MELKKKVSQGRCHLYVIAEDWDDAVTIIDESQYKKDIRNPAILPTSAVPNVPESVLRDFPMFYKEENRKC